MIARVGFRKSAPAFLDISDSKTLLCALSNGKAQIIRVKSNQPIAI